MTGGFRSGTQLMPTSITTEPCLIQSPRTDPDRPTAATRISAQRASAGRSRVREWAIVTVQLAVSSNCAIGLPPMFERPITTARAAIQFANLSIFDYIWNDFGGLDVPLYPPQQPRAKTWSQPCTTPTTRSICEGMRMTFNQFRRYLATLGARFEEGANHTKVYLNGKQTTLPRHASQDMGEGLRHRILRQLGVKQKDK